MKLLEQGSYYRNRIGKIVGPIDGSGLNGIFRCDGLTWNDTGKYRHGLGLGDNEMDLVERIYPVQLFENLSDTAEVINTLQEVMDVISKETGQAYVVTLTPNAVVDGEYGALDKSVVEPHDPLFSIDDIIDTHPNAAEMGAKLALEDGIGLVMAVANGDAGYEVETPGEKSMPYVDTVIERHERCLLDSANWPVEGSVWRHWRNGSLYVIRGISNKLPGKQDKRPITVEYMDFDSDEPFSRKLSEWHGSFEETALAHPDKVSLKLSLDTSEATAQIKKLTETLSVHTLEQHDEEIGNIKGLLRLLMLALNELTENGRKNKDYIEAIDHAWNFAVDMDLVD